MAASDVLLGVLSGASGYLQGRAKRKRFEELQQAEQAKQERELASQQELRKMAMAQALLGSEFVTPEAKNKILATIMPEFQQTRETQERVAAPITEPPVQIEGFAPTAATNIPPNIPLPGELPRADLEKTGGEYMDVLKRLGVTPDAQIIERELQARQQAREMTPVSMPLTPRGEIGAAEIKPAEGFLKAETVTEPIAAFQEKPTTARTEKDELATGLLKEGYSLYPKMTPEDRQKFVTSLDAFRRTKNPTDIYLPSTLPADTSEDEKRRLNELLIQQRTSTSKAYEDLAKGRLAQLGEKEVTKPITQTAKANFLRGLKKDVESNPTIKGYNQAARYVGLINTIVDDLNRRIKSGESMNRIATDQAVINLWNRIQEPGSVTRIEEFRTTAQGEPIVNRLSSLIQKVKSGGAGITVESMNEIKRLANIVGQQLTNDVNIDVEGYRQVAKQSIPDIDETTLNSIARRYSTKDFGGLSETTLEPKEKVQTPEGEFGNEDIDKLFEKKE